jgi:hypothetical protein
MMILCLFGFFSGTRKHPHNDMITEPKDTAGNNHYQSLAVISNDYQTQPDVKVADATLSQELVSLDNA